MVDNGSRDNSVNFVQQNYPEVKIIALPKNFGFATAVNVGIQQSSSEFVVLLNVDTVPQPDWLASLVETIEQSPSDVGSLASKMLSMDDPTILDDVGNSFSWYGSATKRGRGESAQEYTQPEEVFSACAGAALYRRTFLEVVGNFDEYFVSYLEDIDLGLRGQILGYRCLFVPNAQIMHQWRGANIPRPQYVYLTTRNRLIILLKNIPWPLLVKHSFSLLYGQFYFFLVYKKPLYSLKGLGALLLALPRVFAHRRKIQREKKITNQTLESLLARELGEPSLGNILSAKLRWK